MSRNNALTNISEALPSSRRIFILSVLRFALATSVILFFRSTFQISTSPFVFVLTAGLGTFLPVFLIRHHKSFFRCGVTHCTVLLGFFLCFYVAQNTLFAIDAKHASWDFFVATFLDHSTIVIVCYCATFVATWLYWTWAQVVTLEAFFGAMGIVWALSGHRYYHLDAPIVLSRLAWTWNVAPESLILAISCIVAALIGIYLYASSTRPLLNGAHRETHQDAKRHAWIDKFAVLFLVLALFSYAYVVRSQYQKEASRASNGVGQESEQGKSPLGFHSAVGQTKQPAALVRLEGDYGANPWNPMLYFREGALSDYNGHELVISAPEYDTDVPRIRPGEEFLAPQTPDPRRTDLQQTIYLLSDHDRPFAVDRPTRFRPIKNPDPQRFVLAYQAESAAPVVPLSQVLNLEVGDEHWSSATWEHYLRAPGSRTKDLATPVPTEQYSDKPLLDSYGEDLRYRLLADTLTKATPQPVLRASEITQYLSRESIYTRQPGHQVDQQADPVAPYLFAEKKRGYCVHFAHAAVYLMRLAGIPARIGTGYLTDLTYAKDGHILLQLGDRHAWPEIYVRGIGWTVVDVSPATAENEQVSVPDEKLLEELMSKIDPSVEFLTPAETSSLPETDTNPFLPGLPSKTSILALLYLLASVVIGSKLWLRYSYVFPSSTPILIARYYRAAAVLLLDLGFRRRPGETRREFAQRVDALGLQLSGLSLHQEKVRYATRAVVSSYQGAQADYSQFTMSLRQNIPLWKRVLSFCNMATLLRWRSY